MTQGVLQSIIEPLLIITAFPFDERFEVNSWIKFVKTESEEPETVLKLTPVLKDYIWGGYRLKELFGRDNSGKKNIRKLGSFGASGRAERRKFGYAVRLSCAESPGGGQGGQSVPDPDQIYRRKTKSFRTGSP